MSIFGGRRSDGGDGSTWMSGLISGAGKVISSVFGSDESQSSSSSSYSYSNSDSAEEEHTDVSSKGMGEEKQMEEKPETAKEYNGRSLAIISEIEPKRAIEQLIKKETFSREEFYHLTKIIQSRVIGEDGIHKELFDRFPGDATASPGAWKSSNQAKEVLETISFSPSSLDVLSPRFSATRVLPPNLHHSAVMEAKKWLDDKRLASSSDLDIRYEPHSLNACLPRYDVEGRVGSPVDMAKSYMRSLPPWKSFPLCSSEFEKTPPIATHLYKEMSPYATANHSSSSSKSLKRNYFDLGLKDTFDEIRKVRRKAAENMSENPKFKIIDLSAAYSEREACQTSAEQKCIYRDSRNLSASESRDAPENLSLELPAKGICSVGALTLPNETVEVSNPVRVGSIISVNLIPDAEETVNAVETTLATSFHTTLPLRANSTIGSGFQLCGPAALVSNETQDAQEISKVKERVDSLSVPRDFPSLPPTLVQHDGVNVENSPSSTSQLMIAVGTKSAPSGAEAVTSLNDVITSSRKTSSLSQKLVSSVEEVQAITGSKQYGNVKTETEANGFRNSTSCSTAGFDADLHVAANDRQNPSNYSNIEHVMDISMGSSDHSADVDTKAPLKRTGSSRGRPRAGARKKPVKDELTETQPSTSHARGRKAVPRPRRGRGRGM